MLFMNSWEIDRCVAVYDRHPILGPAARTLQNLERWTNENSDGWAYWPKPCRAAKKLQELLQRDYRYGDAEVTEAEYKAALRPIKAFRTRQGADFEIEVSVPERLEELRKVIRSESISYGEIAELQGLAEFITEGDVELLQWAGVPEFPEDEEPVRSISDAEALDALNLLLSAEEWPGASGMEDVLEIVRKTGRVEIANAPVWERH